MQDGGFISDAVAVIDTSRNTGRRVLVDAGGVRPRRGRGLKGRCLTFAEREEIALGRAAGESLRSMGARLQRSPSTISRELTRNHDPHRGYRATTAQVLAYERASQPKPNTVQLGWNGGVFGALKRLWPAAMVGAFDVPLGHLALDDPWR